MSYNSETASPRQIILNSIEMGSGYSRKLTRATCLLQAMKGGNLDAFAQARAEFPEIINEHMSLKEQVNKLWGWCKYGFPEKPVHQPAEDDAYCSGECWDALFQYSHNLRSKL